MLPSHTPGTMSKKRRTKKEKLTASESRIFREVPQVSLPSQTISLVQGHAAVSTMQSPSKTPTRSYTYVIKDVRNTLAITSVIIAFNIALFMVLKLKLVNLFGIVF